MTVDTTSRPPCPYISPPRTRCLFFLVALSPTDNKHTKKKAQRTNNNPRCSWTVGDARPGCECVCARADVLICDLGRAGLGGGNTARRFVGRSRRRLGRERGPGVRLDSVPVALGLAIAHRGDRGLGAGFYVRRRTGRARARLAQDVASYVASYVECGGFDCECGGLGMWQTCVAALFSAVLRCGLWPAGPVPLGGFFCWLAPGGAVGSRAQAARPHPTLGT